MPVANTREQLIKESYRVGQLKWLLYPHQLPLYDAIRKACDSGDPLDSSYVINSARQFGKSFICFLIAVEDCLRNRNHTYVHIAPLKSQAAEIINGKTFGTIFAQCPPELVPKIDGSTIMFYNGSRIRLAGTDNKNYESLRGGAANRITLDEAAFMSELLYGVLPVVEPMLKTTGGKVIYASTPPTTLDHDYVDILREHRERGLCSTFTIYDDKGLTEQQLAKIIKQCGGVETTKFKREYLCMLVTETDLSIVAEWKKDFEHEVVRDEFFPFYHKYVALDTGFVDLTAAIFGYYDFYNAKLVIEDEYYINGPMMTTEILAANLKGKEKELWNDMPVRSRIADNNNLIIIQDLSVTYRLPFIPTNKEYLEEMVNKVRVWVAQGKIVVNPKCVMLIGCLQNGIWTKNRDKFEKSKKFGHYDHLAALVYLIRNIDVLTNPVPPMYKLDSANMHIHPSIASNETENMKRLHKALLPRRVK